MGDYGSKNFAEQGNAALAAQYADPAKVLPEIFVKGVRNPYTLKVVHPVKRWVAFGDVGPDGKGGNTEEFNILKAPGFAGWNVWSGEKQIYSIGGVTLNATGVTALSEGQSKGGASGLPPIIRSQYDVLQSSAMSGPIYWYDGKLKSSRKFPAHYHGKWFVADNDQSGWSGAPWVKVLTMDLVPPFPTAASLARQGSPAPGIRFTALGEFRLSGWNGPVRLFDVLGNEVPLRHQGNGVYRLQEKPTAAVYFLKAGAQMLKVSNIGAK